MTATPERVLIVEDEPPIREGLDALFQHAGFEVYTAADGLLALERFAEREYALVLLDLMIPGMTGLEVLREIRRSGNDTPVLVLTAKGAEEDIVLGLEAGADDYVTKPFGIRELVARAKGLVRRPRATEVRKTLVVGEAALDLEALEVRWAGQTVQLTHREACLLQHLASQPGRAVSRAELLVQVWGYSDGTVRTRTVDVHVQQLRAKLRDVPGGAAWITTVRGRGYRFCGLETT